MTTPTTRDYEMLFCNPEKQISLLYLDGLTVPSAHQQPVVHYEVTSGGGLAIVDNTAYFMHPGDSIDILPGEAFELAGRMFLIETIELG